MRPTGPLHIGHYFGALVNWIALQDEFDCYYFVADWHVLTDRCEKLETVPVYTREMAADWLACGLDPNRAVLFVQSRIPEHLELAWIFGALATVGMLERCPTYKDVADPMAGKGTPSYALLGYPVLQTADIALYKGQFVPVGEDQVAHLELSREIIRLFNRTYGEVFPEPQPRLTTVSRLAGTDGRKKMSKSLGNVIDLGEDPAPQRKRMLGMFTDPQRTHRTIPGRPEICNVYAYHGLFNPDAARREAIAADCRSAKIGCIECKTEMADHVGRFLAPIRERCREWLAKPKELDEILDAGTQRARARAQATMNEVREAMFASRRS
jgi:tryptophanyl-tRNA synthetase